MLFGSPTEATVNAAVHEPSEQPQEKATAKDRETSDIHNEIILAHNLEYHESVANIFDPSTWNWSAYRIPWFVVNFQIYDIALVEEVECMHGGSFGTQLRIAKIFESDNCRRKFKSDQQENRGT